MLLHFVAENDCAHQSKAVCIYKTIIYREGSFGKEGCAQIIYGRCEVKSDVHIYFFPRSIIRWEAIFFSIHG